MKRLSFTFCFFILFALAISAQSGYYSRGLEYLAELNDTSMLFMDVAVNNYNNNPVSAVGVNRTERVFHYSSSHRYGETLFMISIFHQIAAIEYSEFYVFDKYQNLVRYIYSMAEVELIFKIEDKNVSIVSEKNRSSFEDNYFLNQPENYFTYESIAERCANQFVFCTALIGIPNYNKEIVNIREVYKSINADKNLLIEKEGNITKYVRDGNLVKVVITNERNFEYYFDGGEIIFAFVSAGNDFPEQRLYLYNSVPFKLLFGKDNLNKDKDDFWDFSSEMINVYKENFTD